MRIYIEPTGGLCDRLATFECFLNYRNKFSIDELNILWNLNEELNCKYENLFKQIDNVKVTNVKRCILYNYRFTRRILNFFLKTYRGKRINLNNVNRETVIDLIQQKNKVWFTGFIFDEIRDKMYFDEFKAINEIQEKLIVKEKSYNTIGVHIRRTDNKIAIQNSPTELFYREMDYEISLNQDIKFYCATDSEDELKNLINKYGKRVLFQQKCIRTRNSQEGIESALIDLLNLSNSLKIIGSDWSAFSGVAAKIGKIEIQRIIRK